MQPSDKTIRHIRVTTYGDGSIITYYMYRAANSIRWYYVCFRTQAGREDFDRHDNWTGEKRLECDLHTTYDEALAFFSWADLKPMTITEGMNKVQFTFDDDTYAACINYHDDGSTTDEFILY